MTTVDLNTIRILEEYKNGKITAEQAAEKLADATCPAEPDQQSDPEAIVPDAILDIGREERAGFPEAIYAASKTPQQVCTIFSKLFEATGKALATRCSEATMQLLAQKCPQANLNHECGLAWATSEVEVCPWGKVVILAAGTSDIPVAEEAALTLEFSGFMPVRIFDVGVAGIHRLLNRVDQFRDADAVIVVAGMEGALPSVVGGLTSCPVIAVPTSVGYGASFNGIAALLGMLNSCSAGITTVNIDNGFGAAAAAVRILKGKNK